MIDVIRIYYFFFFSSRRRHTISTRDWSSDVCSSDLSLDQYTVVFAKRLVVDIGQRLKVGDVFVRAKPLLRKGEVETESITGDRKSTRLNSSHEWTSYAVVRLKRQKRPDEDKLKGGTI